MTKAAVSYTLSLRYEIKKEQLDVIVQYVLGRDVFAVLPTGYGNSWIVNRSSSSTLQSQNPTLPQPQQLGENEGDAIQSQWIF